MDGVMHPSVEQAIGRDRIRNALKRYENNPVDKHDRGLVRAVNSDGSYEVLLDGDVQTARCAPYANAMVGDRVIVVTTKDGENVLLGRLGGETETIVPTIEERFEKLETDYIVAEGTSGVWEYIKFASGIGICWRASVDQGTTFSAWGTGYISAAYSQQAYPFKFIEKPAFIPMVAPSNKDYTMNAVCSYSAIRPDQTEYSPSVYAFRPSSVSGEINVDFMMVAIGRWK